eukprot:CAMPEP_0201618608 /NCGR_PEP_ID=MMETSP0492-20130828/39423_1 /ASSEMBLY_ACC=CAM_ASM_000837 /TAXON_ID=420259 /ORGANISM="Thalassiosira gravida, Strain GMp14c1" /LENGTH=46 /DNA_ID= /DNA_START= /DNA_END= /DNA_ORIENTATION=
MATKEKGGACCGRGRIQYGCHVVVKEGELSSFKGRDCSENGVDADI